MPLADTTTVCGVPFRWYARIASLGTPATSRYPVFSSLLATAIFGVYVEVARESGAKCPWLEMDAVIRSVAYLALLVIGLTISIDIFVGGGLTGAAMNPARWFGPAVVQGIFSDWWVYFVGPGIGGAVAGILYPTLFMGGLRPATETPPPAP